MKLPPGKTEEEVIKTIERIVNRLAPIFVYGYNTLEDIKQDGFILALEALEEEVYDPSRSLDSFLYVHIKNRLGNNKRDHYRRNDPPCEPCHIGEYCTEHGPCHKYERWRKLNDSKSSVMCPLDITNINDEGESNTKTNSSIEDEVQKKEMLRIIDEKLPIEFRAIYLQVKAGVKVQRNRRIALEKVLREILADYINE